MQILTEEGQQLIQVLFVPRSEEEMNDWIQAFQDAIDRKEKRSETFKTAVHGLETDTPALKVVCARCSDYKAELQYDGNRPNRVCQECFIFLTGHTVLEDREGKHKGILEKGAAEVSSRSLLCSSLQLLDKNGKGGTRGWFVIPQDDPLVLYIYAAPQVRPGSSAPPGNIPRCPRDIPGYPAVPKGHPRTSCCAQGTSRDISLGPRDIPSSCVQGTSCFVQGISHCVQRTSHPTVPKGHPDVPKRHPGTSYCAQGTSHPAVPSDMPLCPKDNPFCCAQEISHCPQGTSHCPQGTSRCPQGTSQDIPACPGTSHPTVPSDMPLFPRNNSFCCAQETSHCAQRTSHCPQGTSHCAQETSHCAQRTSRCAQRTSRCPQGTSQRAQGHPIPLCPCPASHPCLSPLQDVRAHTSIPLLGYQVRDLPQSESRHLFQLVQSRQVFTFVADTEELKQRWMKAMARAAAGITEEEEDEDEAE
uniref:PH domain-containing protein n=1 Tax=Junco hyemalis TaxID=40217 RepID=A0A8C5JMW6_JUNHY